jgi:hypothetical protein
LPFGVTVNVVEHVPFFKALRTVPLSVQTFFDAVVTLITTFEEATTVILAFCIRHEREMFRDFFTVHAFGVATMTIGTAVVVVVVEAAREVSGVETSAIV